MVFAAWSVIPAALSYVTVVLSQSPDLSNVVMKSVSYGGSGCPQGTLNYTFTNADTYITHAPQFFHLSLLSKKKHTYRPNQIHSNNQRSLQCFSRPKSKRNK